MGEPHWLRLGSQPRFGSPGSLLIAALVVAVALSTATTAASNSSNVVSCSVGDVMNL